MSLIVIINGIDNCGESKAADNLARKQLFCEQFPKDDVLMFDSFYEHDGLLHDGYPRDMAEAVIKNLQQYANKSEPQRIVFIGHNTGAVLVKQILLVASEEHRHLWITFKTVALYFVESPSYKDQRQWEQFILRLLSTDRLPSCNLPVLINVLPKAMARIELEFSAISNAFDIKDYGCDFDAISDSEHDLWKIHEDNETRLRDVFLTMRAFLRRDSTQLDSDYQRFQKLLSHPDAAINRLNAITVLPKFMTWIDSNESYNSWLNNKKSAVLRITGPNGSGNTYLSSHILHMLMAKNPGPESLFLSYGCYRWDIRRNSERSLVVSMIRQLLTLRPGFYRRVGGIAKFLSSKPSLSTQLLWALLRYLLTIPRHSSIFLVLNAVDQCLQPIAENVGLLTTMSSITIPLKIIMTSSVSLELADNVSCHSINLKDGAWENIIRSMAEERVSRIVEERLVWKDSKQAIVEKLFSGEYTYLKVMLNLDILAHSKLPSTEHALKQRLKAPTLSIEKAFDSLFSGLDKVELAKSTLNWILHAVRPLTVSELAVALALQHNPVKEEPTKKLTFETLVENISWDPMRDLAGILEGTVKIVNNHVYFAHHTFHDYLQEHGNILIPNFHASITEWCILYISLCSEYTAKVSMEYDSLEEPRIGVAAAFLEYAELYWTEHYKLAQRASLILEKDEARSSKEQEEQSLDEKQEYSLPGEKHDPLEEKKDQPPGERKEHLLDLRVAQFLTSDTLALKQWIGRSKLAFSWSEEVADDDHLLLAIQLGLRPTFRSILQEDQQNQKRIEKGTIIAAQTGNVDILEDLLQVAGSDALLPALRAAAEYGHTNSIGLLLAKIRNSGIEFPAPATYQDSDSPLLLAALNGHTAAFETLLLERYSMTALDSSKNTVVHLSSQLGDLDTLQVMQNRQNDTFKSLMASTNDSDMSPLQLTCKAGSFDAFELVLDNSPEDQMRLAKGDSMSPIQLAAEAGHGSIVKRLIAAGVIVSFDSSSDTPLRLAAGNGHYDVVYYLVEEVGKTLTDSENTSNINSNGEELQQCLDESLDDAISNGWAKVAEFLLSKTKRDPEDDKDRNYIRRAVNGGYLDILKVLVDAGIPVKRESDKYNSILDIAIRKNFVDIVSYLLDKGVAPQWDGGENSIHYAAGLGYTLCLRELLLVATLEDARRKNRKSNYTPLDVAAQDGELETLKQLLKWEKDHALPGQPWRPQPKALVLAIKSREYSWRKWTKLELVSFLLDNGWTADVADLSQDVPIHAAVEDGNIDMVRLLIQKGSRIKAINHSKQTVLHVAVQHNEAKIAAFLLENGARPDLPDTEGLTPLHAAIKQEKDDSVRVLLGLDGESNDAAKERRRANVEQEAPDGSRALHFACNSALITSTLLELKPKPDLNPVRKDSKVTPLILAASEGSDDVIQLLLKAGANVEARDPIERTALYHAAIRGHDHIDIVRYLLDYKANPDAGMFDQSTPLYAAIRNGNDKIACYLLDEAKANPKLYGGTLHSPLQAAAFRGELDIATRLLKAKADPNAHGGVFGSPLHAAMRDGNVKLIELLLSNEYKTTATINIPPFGTPLHVLCSIRNKSSGHFKKLVSLLLKYDADMINCKYNGYTPLIISVPAEEDALTLLNLGADPDLADDNGATALHHAATFHSPDILRALLERKPNLETRDGCSRSVLYLAAISFDETKFKAVLDRIPVAERKPHLEAVVPAALRMRSKTIFELITKEEGIDLNVPDRNGWTGLDVANYYEMSHEVTVLKEMGAKNGSTKEEPTEWCSENKEGGIQLSENKREAWMEGLAKGFDLQNITFSMMGSVLANHCIPIDKPFYFEVEILECGKNSIIAVGLAQECIAIDALVGWPAGTWAYHSDDGSILTDDDRVDRGPAFGSNSTIGVTVDPVEKTACFSLDGVRVGKTLENVVGQLYPTVSFQQGLSKVKITFPAQSSEFKYPPQGPLSIIRLQKLGRRRTALRAMEEEHYKEKKQ